MKNEIKRFSDLGYQKFVQELRINGISLHIIKKKENSTHCSFWDEEKSICQIYANRPLDCRLFPFDICWYGDAFYWIVYSCNPNSDWSWTEEYLKQFENDPSFSEILEHLSIYQSLSTDYVDESVEPPFAVVRKVVDRSSCISNSASQETVAQMSLATEAHFEINRPSNS